MQEQSASELSPVALGAWRGLLRAHAAIVEELDRELQDAHDLPLTAYEVLVVLESAPDRRLRMSELASSVFLSQSGVTRLVDRLERDRLVRRERCDDDRRGLFARITPVGLRRLRAARPTHLAGVRRCFAAEFTDEELRDLASLWERLLPGASS
jgi:DNA-binding MarR family transcriptional regulator